MAILMKYVDFFLKWIFCLFLTSGLLPRLLHRDIDMDGARQGQKNLAWLHTVNASLLLKKGKLYRSACFQLVSKLSPFQKQFFFFGKCHWFSSLLPGSDLFVYFQNLPFFQPHQGHQPAPYIFLILLCCLSFLRDREHCATRNNPCCISLKCPCWVVFKLLLPKSHPSPIKRESSSLQKLLRWSECSVRMEEKVWALKVRKSRFQSQFCHLIALTLGELLNFPKLHSPINAHYVQNNVRC